MSSSDENPYELLTRSSRLDELRNSHRDYYVALAEQAESALREPDQAAWRRLLESEYDNIIQAFEWSLERGDEQAALRLSLTISEIWYYRGADSKETREYFERALSIGGGSPSGLRARALLNLSSAMPTYEQQRLIAHQSLDEAQKAGDRKAEAAILRSLANRSWRLEGTEEAGTLFERSLEIVREIDDELLLADTAFTLLENADWKATSLKSLDVFRRHGDKESIAWLLYGMAWDEEDGEIARSYADESLAIARELGNDNMILNVIQLIGYLLRASGDDDGAIALYESALEEYRRPGRKWPIDWGVAWMLLELAQIEIDQGKFDLARHHAGENLEISRRIGRPALGSSLSQVGVIALAEGDYPRAKKLCEEAVALFREGGAPSNIAKALVALSYVALCGGDLDLSMACYEKFLGLGEGGKGLATEFRLQAFARVLTEAGRYDEAKTHLEEALVKCDRAFWKRSTAPLIEIDLGRVYRLMGDFATSRSHSAAGTRKIHGFGHLPHLALCLEERAALRAARGDFPASAKIYGSADALREVVHTPVPLHEKRHYVREVQEVRDALGENSFEKAWGEGLGLPLEEAVAFALVDI